MKKVTRPAPIPTRPPFEGDIDGLSGDEVRGWIVDTSDPGRYIYVCLFVNYRFIEKRWAAFFAKISDSCFGVEASMAFRCGLLTISCAKRSWKFSGIFFA